MLINYLDDENNINPDSTDPEDLDIDDVLFIRNNIDELVFFQDINDENVYFTQISTS
jgi:poly(3-hydroxybutyrate) depolymerase